jgi:hypothetical protein
MISETREAVKPGVPDSVDTAFTEAIVPSSPPP